FSNVFDVIKHNGNSEEDVKTFRENMSDKKQGAMRFKFDGSDYVFAFAPIEETDGWYLVSAIPNSSVIQHTQNILKTSQSFVFIFAAAIVIFALFVFVTYFYRKRVHAKETEVKYREQLFGLLANNTDDVFLMLSSEDLAVEYVSPNVERVLGVPSAEVKESVTALKNTDYADGSSVDEAALRNLPADGSVTYECEREHKETGARKFFLETVYRTSMGASEKFIVVLSDRTKERQTEYAIKEALESAQAANKAKSVFLSNMSHDIRTPMNAIIGFTELLKRDASDADKVMQHTRKISSSGQHLLGLINDILDMSKIENGKTVLNVCEFSLPELVEDLDDIMRPQAKAKKQRFDIVVHGIKEEKLLGDKLRINQILMNILSNAVKYTPEGGKILMEIRGLPRVNANFARLCFTVKDNGIGMSEEFLENIFKPFTREVSSTVNQIQGTGLGMSIAKNLVELMGGTISVESKQGEGSTFKIELELRISDGAAEHDFFRDHKICKALVVDDDADCCEGVVETLDGIGIETQSALSGAQAIDIVRTAHECGKDYDLILVDMKMPGMDGIETTRAIRKIVPKEASVMLLTAYDWSGVEQKAEKAGIDAFLPKPFFLSNLKQTIRNINGKKSGGVQETEDGQSLEGRRFLVAEDNELNSEILCELLDMKGVTCEVACDGKQALEMFEKSEENYYDAVLMDIQMPVMNGYEATKAIRASAHPRANTIPIIAMTANAFAEDINNALSSGMDAHVAKPVDMNRLEKVLTEHLYKGGNKN
ncbi:MAG: response regulator, partial [Clostridia bacterium]|nr:response regulator [Clostridia bacterium]